MTKNLYTKNLCIMLFLVFFICYPIARAHSSRLKNSTNAEQHKQKEHIYIVNEYRYVPVETAGDSDIGQALCGTRCNAMSAEYQNYLTPGGWRMTKIADSQELVVDLNNPFMAGKCVCVADKYLLQVNELYMSK